MFVAKEYYETALTRNPKLSVSSLMSTGYSDRGL